MYKRPKNLYAKTSIVSKCDDVVVKGNRHQVAQKWEDLAAEEENGILAERFRQQAEHYRKPV